MSQGNDERRQHRRHDAVMAVVLRLELHGYDEEHVRFEANGRTVNVSRGGLLARIDRTLAAGTRCLAHFPDATGMLGRTLVFGEVRRCTGMGDRWEVAVVFDTPLVEIDIPGQPPA